MMKSEKSEQGGWRDRQRRQGGLLTTRDNRMALSTRGKLLSMNFGASASYQIARTKLCTCSRRNGLAKMGQFASLRKCSMVCASLAPVNIAT
jgi:hypothetical protein